MTDEDTNGHFDIGGMFRNSATITFVVEILSIIVMVGSVLAWYIGGFLDIIAPEIQILLLLILSIITLIVFLAAFSVFLRFSRRLSHAVVGSGLEQVRMNAPRVKAVIFIYGLLVLTMFATGVYIWYLVDLWFLMPWAASHTSISLRIFGYALGAFFISLLIQIIVALIGRTSTRLIVEVLDADDSDFVK
ncbi:MAG: hypothetical protein V3U94_03055 [Candidatus Thorarchaeota archaeon]